MKLKANIIRDGTSQRSRKLEALDPAYFSVEERTLADWMRYAQEFSSYLTYFNEQDQPDGDWSAFFAGDPDAIAEAIESLDLNDSDEKPSSTRTDILELISRPHFALFLTFLKLLQYPQQQFRELTQRRLDFYYRQILQLSEKEAIPDHAHIIFSLASRKKEELIAKGTRLSAGKDATGKELQYATDTDLYVNLAQVASVKTLSIDRVNEETQSITARTIAEAAPDKAIDLPQFQPFAKSASSDSSAQALGLAIAAPILQLQEGDRKITLTIHVATEKPFPDQIQLQDYLAVAISNDSGWLPLPIDQKQNTATISTDDSPTEPDASSHYHSTLQFVFTLDAAQPAITKIPDNTPSGIESPFPIIKVSLIDRKENKSKDKTLEILKGFLIEEVDIHVAVNNLDNLKLRNDRSVINPQNPFHLFTHQPRVNSAFYFYHPELVSKSLESLSMDLIWIDLPKDFSDYYATYTSCGLSPDISNDSFQANLGLFQNREWMDAETSQSLFTTEVISSSPESGQKTRLSFDQTSLTKLCITNVSRPEKLQNGVDPWKHNSYFRLKLQQTDFQHDIYPLVRQRIIEKQVELNAGINARKAQELKDLVTKTAEENWEKYLQIIREAQNEVRSNSDTSETNAATAPPEVSGESETTDGQNGTVASSSENKAESNSDMSGTNAAAAQAEVSGEEQELPTLPEAVNPPYTPQLKSITINYTASVAINLTEKEINTKLDNRSNETSAIKLFQLHPFGYEELPHPRELNDDIQSPYYLLPQYDDEGILYIGIRDLQAPQRLTLLFQMLPGSGRTDLRPPKIQWSYLRNNDWQQFEPKEILGDGTNNLLDSGIIHFVIPESATNQNNLLPAELHWIRATVSHNTVALPYILGIHTQAVAVTFVDRGNELSHLSQPLPANSIASFVKRNPKIATIEQRYNTFGGRPTEKSNLFYSRVSERLRHKRRAIASWDYERLVLEAFPEIYKVKCLTQAEQHLAPNAAQVTVVIIPRLHNTAPVLTFEPKASQSLLHEVEEFLRDYTSPFVKVLAKNPRYEQIKYRIGVRFRDGCDPSYYKDIINEELVSFLSPWATDDTSDISFSRSIHRSSISHFLDTKPYVDYVTNPELLEQLLLSSEHSSVMEAVYDSQLSHVARVKHVDSILVSAPSHRIDVITEADEQENIFEGIGYMILDLDFFVT